MALGLAALAAAPLRAQTRQDYCGLTLPPGLVQQSHNTHSGRYLNSRYGYSVTIPAGLTAASAAEGPERGFVIGLSASPRAFLSLDASYDVFYDLTAAGVHRRDLNTITLHDRLLSDTASDAVVAQLQAQRYRMQFQCRDAQGPAIHEEVIVVRDREIYRLDLQTTLERYAQDVKQLELLLKSWRWEPIRE